MLTIKDLTVSIADKEIIHDFSYVFEKGKTYVVMGPNGSGKSTLASAVMGNPVYSVSDGSEIIFNKKSLVELESYERAQKGIFMTFQSPLALSGVTVFQLLRKALGKEKDVTELYDELVEFGKKLSISPDLLERSLNDGFSGGERKKMELLQAAILKPTCIFFDEIDTGVDVDSLKKIGTFMSGMKSKDSIFIIITHHSRILKYIKPDKVLVLDKGKLVKVGDADLAEEIEKKGYTTFI
ncbi:MAG: Fe-S cluster assembly ATPase SufC [Candidatus Roizmanbacteria bacterium]